MAEKKDERKSVKVDLATWRKLQNLRTKLNYSSLDEVIKYLLVVSK